MSANRIKLSSGAITVETDGQVEVLRCASERDDVWYVSEITEAEWEKGPGERRKGCKGS